MKTAKQILLDAADLLEEPGAWTQGSYARTKDGQAVHPDEENASCWCMVGALDKLTGPNLVLCREATNILKSPHTQTA